MKAVNLVNSIGIVLLCVLVFTCGVAAQTEAPKQPETAAQSERIARADTKSDTLKKDKEDKKDKKHRNKKSAPEEQVTPDTKEAGENVPEAEAAVLPYYNNYLTEYRLGPNDVISIEVFGQCPDYCISGKIVPPTARISYPLIREGVLVGGKTIEQVQEEITKKLDEYIIDPKVSVTLDKAMSARYSVLGKVAAPGVRVMDRKVSLYEALADSGGILKDGDKKRVTIYRQNGQGRLVPQTINVLEMERGQADMVYLNPGDQVFVPDQGFKLNVNTVFKILEKASVARLLFGSPF